jgi:hypothetical protein
MKNLLIFVSVLILFGCNQSQDANEKDLIQVLVDENMITLSEDGELSEDIEVSFEEITPEDSEEPEWFKVNLIHDNLPDDSVKKTEYEVQIKRGENQEWEITDKILIDLECRRGKVDDLCI